jgi:transposase InsO family protein
MPWKECTTMSQKEAFVSQVLEGRKSISDICKGFGISRTAGHKILKRYKVEGKKGLEACSRIPHSSPNKTPLEMENKILQVRTRHPYWGPRKIHSFLVKQGVINLPSKSTIGEILKRNGCILPEETLKRQVLTRFERQTPNELWQMDFKGHFQLEINQTCYPLTILDDHSRFSLCLHACRKEHILPVKKQLIATFGQYGMPLQINVDNGTPWGNSSLVKYTRLTVWLMRLGIRVTHSRPRHPQTNGKNERFHRTLKEELIKRQQLSNFSQTQKLFNQWRYYYNFERPHQALDMAVPADRYQPSQRQLPTKLITIEYDQNALVRKTSPRGYVSYMNKDYLTGKAFAGYYIELKPNELEGVIELYFGKHKIYTHELS